MEWILPELGEAVGCATADMVTAARMHATTLNQLCRLQYTIRNTAEFDDISVNDYEPNSGWQ
jgi:hypothetical protein